MVSRQVNRESLTDLPLITVGLLPDDICLNVIIRFHQQVNRANVKLIDGNDSNN